MAKGKSKSKAKLVGTKLRCPIADKVLKMMRAHKSANVVDLSAVIEGRKNAEALQERLPRERSWLTCTPPTRSMSTRRTKRR